MTKMYKKSYVIHHSKLLSVYFYLSTLTIATKLKIKQTNRVKWTETQLILATFKLKSYRKQLFSVYIICTGMKPMRGTVLKGLLIIFNVTTPTIWKSFYSTC